MFIDYSKMEGVTDEMLEVLKSDKRAMMKAFGQAQKAADFILASQAQAMAAE